MLSLFVGNPYGTEFAGLDQVEVSYPIHAQTGDPIHVLIQYNEQTLNCPWVHKQPGLADRVLMPLILAVSLYSCANHENHSNRLHTSSDDESEPDEMEDESKEVEMADNRGLIAAGYYELAKWLSRQQFVLFCRYLKPSKMLLVDCYQRLSKLKEIHYIP